jgi:hypothetical protein
MLSRQCGQFSRLCVECGHTLTLDPKMLGSNLNRDGKFTT